MFAILAVAAALNLQAATDTTFAVQPNSRLEVRNTSGDITVRTWNRAAVRVRATRANRDAIRIRNTGSVISVRSVGERGPSGVVDYEITVPATMNLDLNGMYTDVSVQGTRGDVAAKTLNGDVRIRGGRSVSARSVEGGIVIEGARGRVQANTVSDDIRVRDVEGEVSAEAVSGDIVLDRIQSGRVEASTVSGDVFYDGVIRNQGAYSFKTHSGDVVVVAPPATSATVTVATLNGKLDSSFPVSANDARQGRRYTFRLGSGSGRLEMESFSGDIRLRRSGEVRAPDERRRARPRS